MTTCAKTILEWTYEPQGFFEVPFELTFLEGQISISKGGVRGEFDGSCYDQGLEFRERIHAHVSSVFLAQQVQVPQYFKLSVASMAREYADGRRDVTAFIEPIRLKISMGRADVIIRSADGEIVQDTRAERLQKQQDFRESVAALAQGNDVLKRVLQSFSTALSDPDNLLIHLDEIRETFKTEYGSDKSAQEALNVTSKSWSRFGALANNEPLKEGRHRGRHRKLRPATKSEIEHALSFSQELIEKYVSKISRGSTADS